MEYIKDTNHDVTITNEANEANEANIEAILSMIEFMIPDEERDGFI